MNTQEQRDLCPFKIGDQIRAGKVVFILGDREGWTIEARHSGQPGDKDGLVSFRVDATFSTLTR